MSIGLNNCNNDNNKDQTLNTKIHYVYQHAVAILILLIQQEFIFLEFIIK